MRFKSKNSTARIHQHDPTMHLIVMLTLQIVAFILYIIKAEVSCLERLSKYAVYIRIWTWKVKYYMQLCAYKTAFCDAFYRIS